METEKQLDAREGWGNVGGEEWERLQSLFELVRREHRRTELSPERRDQIRERVLERWERIEMRRRRVRALMVGASAALLVGVVLALVVRARVA